MTPPADGSGELDDGTTPTVSDSDVSAPGIGEVIADAIEVAAERPVGELALAAGNRAEERALRVAGELAAWMSVSRYSSKVWWARSSWYLPAFSCRRTHHRLPLRSFFAGQNIL
jgi:hypothetical protein